MTSHTFRHAAHTSTDVERFALALAILWKELFEERYALLQNP